MIRDDWSGIVGADRWWHLEYGLVVLGRLLRVNERKGRLYIAVPDGNLMLTIRASGVRQLTIPDSSETEPWHEYFAQHCYWGQADE